MKNFAVLDNENVLNTIIAESKVIAEEITGKNCVEFTTENAETGGTYVNGIFIQRKPYSSWVLDEEFNWKAPVLYPDDTSKLYDWSEETISWVEVVTEEAIVE
jgi:hypothetical protein